MAERKQQQQRSGRKPVEAAKLVVSLGSLVVSVAGAQAGYQYMVGAAAIAAFVVGYLYVWRPIATLVAMVRKIYAAVVPNGGSSIHDMVRRNTELTELALARTEYYADLTGELHFEADALGNHTRASEALVRQFGYLPDELINRGFEVLMHTEDRARMVVELDDAIQKKRIGNVWGRFVSKSGTLFKVQVHVEPRCDEATGRLIRIFGRVQLLEVAPKTATS